jgi:hypothetical protein
MLLQQRHLWHDHDGKLEIYVETMEKMEEKALRITSGLKGKCYEQRCKDAGLETLKERRRSQNQYCGAKPFCFGSSPDFQKVSAPALEPAPTKAF